MVLVTGITGHTGRYFLKELIDQKYEESIRCIVRETSDTSMLDKSGLNIDKVYGNLNDKVFLRSAVNGADTIIHIYSIHHSPMIVEVAIEKNVKQAILVHTTGIYSNFKQATQVYKEVERKVAEMTTDLDCPTKVTILRPTMIYGDLCDKNMSKFIKMIDKFRIMPVINRGRSMIQPVNARDLGKALYSVLTSPEKTAGKSYNLSGAKALQMIEVFKMISDGLNKKTIFVHVPLGLGIGLAKIVKVLTFKKIDYVEKIQRMGEDRSYPHTEAKNDFGYNPINFEDGIKIEINQYLHN